MRLVLSLALALSFVVAPCSASLLEMGSPVPSYIPSGGSGSAIWEFDSNSDWQPAVAGNSDIFWELDTLGQIIPKESGFELDSDGALQPLN